MLMKAHPRRLAVLTPLQGGRLFVPLAAILLLAPLSFFSFPLFHVLAELIPIVIATSAFTIAWNTHPFSRNNFLLFLATGLFCLGLLDLFHALVYKGMHLYPGPADANLPTQLWIGARYLQAILLLLAPLTPRYPLRRAPLLAGMSLCVLLLFVAIMSGWFPDAFVAGTGLTPFKVASEYLIVAILGAALVLFHQRRADLGPRLVSLIQVAIVATMISELAFTFYVSVFGLSNLVGHLFKILAYWYIYCALVEDGVRASAESEARFKSAFRDSAIGMAMVALDGRWLEANDRLCTMLGYSEKELQDRGVADLIHPGDRGLCLEDARRLVAGDIPTYEIEQRYLRQDGRARWGRLSVSLVRDHLSAPRYFIVHIQDITEIKRAEQALRRSREGLGLLTEASLAIMAETDLDAMLQAVAEAALALTDARLATCAHDLGRSQSVVGGSASAPGAPACPCGPMARLDRGGVHAALLEGAEAVRLTNAELRRHPRWWGLPEGHAPLRGLLGVPLRARNGVTNGMILVTDRGHGDFTSEDETLLRQLATVASLALQHVEARLSLETADRRKDAFLAMLGHELRNPLAPIRNSLAILEHIAPGDETARRAQSVIDRQVTHLTRLVDDLLDVTRIARGKIQLQCERLDFCHLVRRTLDDHRETLSQRELTLETVLPRDALWISGDRTRMAQVIGNLLSNAAKFTPPGGVVRVSVEPDLALGQAVLRVRDSGVGISPDMLPQVFEPFTQADNSLERSGGGLGLGLPTVKGLVELHAGSVRAESEGLGFGTELIVRLPLASAEGPTEASTPASESDGGRRLVLIIEDNVDAAESLRLLLGLIGHRVEVAHSGPEGVEKALERAPDVILCDIGLPGMDGYAVARMLRQDPRLRSKTLVALSGYAAPEEVARARASGFDAHFAKPVSLDVLKAILAGL